MSWMGLPVEQPAPKEIPIILEGGTLMWASRDYMLWAYQETLWEIPRRLEDRKCCVLS